MTDDQMDARLRRAGEAWRSATTPAAETDADDVHVLSPEPARRSRRGRHTGLLASAAVVAAAIVAGAAVLIVTVGGGDETNPSPGDTVGLEGTVWRLVGYGNDQRLPNSPATLHISGDGMLVADDSCGLIGARVDVNQGHLYGTQFQVRDYNCTDSAGEVTFDPDVFASAPSYSLDGAGLTITGAGKTMHLVASPGLPVPTLDRPTVTGATWRLVGVTDPSGTELPVSGEATFRIDNGTLHAGDTCNTLTGPAVLTGRELDTKDLAMTEIGCSNDVAPTAAVVDAVFSGTAQTELLGTRLTISRDAAGSLDYDWIPSDAVATDPANLTGRTWRLTAVAGDPVSDAVTLRVQPDGTTTGNDGCRDINASAEVGPGTLTVTGLPPADFPPTCNGDLAATVDSLLKQQPALWRISEEDLVINGPGAQGFALVYSTGDARPVLSPLLGSAWTLTTIETGTGPDAASQSVTGQLPLAVDQRLQFDDGCNAHTAEVTVGDATLDIGAVGGTQVRCVGPVPDQQHQILAVLDGRVSWRVVRDQLTITKEGVGALVYTKAGAGPRLVGTPWTLTSVQTDRSGSASGSGSSDSRVVLTLDGRGGYRLATGCHVYAGAAAISRSTVTFSDQRDLGGDDCLNTMAEQVVHLLDGPADWSIAHGQLTVTKGNATLTFRS